MYTNLLQILCPYFLIHLIVHLGSNPGFLGFVLRPNKEVRRHSYENILETGYYTVNHIHTHFIEQAHYTSAKFDASISEFDECGLTEEYLFDFTAPFVKESVLKIGLKYIESIPIKSTSTILVVGEIEHLIFPDFSMNEEGYIDLASIGDIGISGLNCYYELKKIKEFPYARVQEVPNFK